MTTLTIVCRFVLTHVAGTARGLEASNSLEAVRQPSFKPLLFFNRGSPDLARDGRSKLVHPDAYDQRTKTLKWLKTANPHRVQTGKLSLLLCNFFRPIAELFEAKEKQP